MHSVETTDEFKAMKWSFQMSFGIQIRLEDKKSVQQCIRLIKQNNDWLNATYWNSFARAHNKFFKKKDHLPCFDIQEVAEEADLIH